MTAQQAPQGAKKDQLLNIKQKAVCEQFASGDGLDNRRAQALLALDAGATQAEAGAQAGLTRYQVKYCLNRFRQKGLAMFPEVASEPVPEPEPIASAAEAEKIVKKPGKKTGKSKKAGKKSAEGKQAKKKRKKSEKKGGKGKKADKPNKSSKKKAKKKSAKKAKKKGKRKSTKSRAS